MPSHNVKLDAGRVPPAWTINIEGYGTINLTTSNASFVCNSVIATRLKREHGSWLNSSTW